MNNEVFDNIQSSIFDVMETKKCGTWWVIEDLIKKVRKSCLNNGLQILNNDGEQELINIIMSNLYGFEKLHIAELKEIDGKNNVKLLY